MSTESPDFVGLYRRFEAMDNGLKAQLRKVAEPDDLRDTPALYRLFSQDRPGAGWLRLVYLLPWCRDCGDERRGKCPSFGKLLHEANVNEMRIFQVARSRSPQDIVQFRRLAMQLQHPVVDLEQLGWLLFPSEPDCAWRKDKKRRLVEDFYLA
jgi:CRISPR system Cascade subunit CasB